MHCIGCYVRNTQTWLDFRCHTAPLELCHLVAREKRRELFTFHRYKPKWVEDGAKNTITYCNGTAM